VRTVQDRQLSQSWNYLC